jgi:Flp pilus assembly protein TadG
MVTRRAHAGGQSGQALPLIVVFMVVLLAFAGLVIDLGNAYRVQQALQASTDASAAAGAGQLTLAYPPNTGNAIARAQYYGSEPGGHNSIPGVPSSGVTQTVSTSCVLTVSTLPCTNANTVTVRQSASVPTYFLRVLGVNSLKISTSAQACSPCNEIPLDIQLVIDRTGSMADQSSGIVKWTALQQGLLKGFLPGLDPSVDYVGLSTLPPDTNGTSDICKAETGTSPSPYDAPNPTYTVVHLSNNYMNSSGQLIASSPLVSDINCMKPGGGTDYADAMTAAYAELQANGRPGVQKVIVLLSDGAANNGQGCVTTTKKVGGKTVTVKDTKPHCIQPCQSAVNDAATYKANNVLIYTILYGDQSGGPACEDYTGANEVPAIQPWTAMQNIASPGNYYPDPNPANLQTVFQEISADMAAGSSRIVS